MDSKKLKAINDTRDEKDLASIRHKENIAHIDNVAQTGISTTESLIKYLEGHTSKTEVVNHLQSISTPDVEFVVKALEVLDKTIKARPTTDLSGVTQLMQELVNEAKLIPKEIPETPENEKPIDYTQQLTGLADAIKAVERVVKAQKLVAEAPVINVPETTVHVDAPDLEPLQNGFRDVVKAVQKIVIPEYKTDNTAVEKLLKSSNALLKNILEKPVGGGGGGGSSWVATKADGIPVPLNLDSSGNLKIAGTFSSTTTNDGTFAKETGGNLDTIAAKDFATQTTLALIKAKTDNLDIALSTRAVTGLTDTQLRATAVPVSGTFFQTTQPVSLATNTPDVTDRAARLLGHVTVDNATLAVTGTFFQATQPVSAASLPLPTGAATSGNQTTANSSLSSIDTKLSGTLAVTGAVSTVSAVVSVGQKTVNTTAVQIIAGSTIPTNGILIGALSTNTAPIFVGGSGVTTSTGAELLPGASLPFTANLNTLYIISVASTTDKIWYNVT